MNKLMDHEYNGVSGGGCDPQIIEGEIVEETDFLAYLTTLEHEWRQRNLKPPPTYQRRRMTDEELREWAKDPQNHDIYF